MHRGSFAVVSTNCYVRPAAGLCPQFDTTLQFCLPSEAHCQAHFREHAQSAAVRLELHACQPGAPAGSKPVLLGAAQIPLSGLLEGEAPEAAAAQQSCRLVDGQGRPCGSISFTVRALPR